MKHKRITAMMLAIVMITSFLPFNVLANIQLPPTDFYANIAHKKSGESTVIPDVMIGWTRPEIAANEDGDTSGQSPPTDIVGSHDLSGYDLYSEDFMGFSPSREMPIGADDTEQDISTLLESGVFYNLNLVARHLHRVTDDETGDSFDTIIESEPANLKLITNFNTQVTGTDEGLEVKFEYIPGIEYLVGYTQGAAENIGDFPDNSTITVTQSDLGDNNIITDPNDGRKYVVYLISEGVSPGQMYSVYVMPNLPEGDPLKEKTTIGSDPKVVSAITSIPLRVFNVGNGKIRLEWNISASILENSYSLTKTSIFAQVSGQNAQEIFTFQKDNGALIGYYELYEPEVTTMYWLEFEFTNEDTNATLSPSPTTGKVEYIPYDAVEKPASPQIPKPFNDDIDLNAEIAKEYLVKGDTTPYNVENFKKQTFTMINDAPVQIQLVWDAYEGKVDANGNKTLDYELVYDIWVTERKEALDSSLVENGLAPIERNVFIDPDDEDSLVTTPFGDVVGFKKVIAEYYDVSEAKLPLATNKTYYIQIVAKRQDAARFATSEPTIVAITIDKNGDIFYPPILLKPPILVKPDSITNNSADIIWREQWQELMYKGAAADEDFYQEFPENIPLAKQWNSKVYLLETEPKVLFKAPLKVETLPINLITYEHLDMVRDYVGVNFYENNFTSREISLGSGIKYEMQTLPYEDVKNLQGDLELEDWIFMVAQEGGSADWEAGWEELAVSEYIDETSLIWQEHKVVGLIANTAYITFIRAYRTLDDGTRLTQSYPSYIIYNTLANFVSEEEVPIVPNLNLNEVTDHSIEVFFKFNHKFDYEMVYSRFDDPEGPESMPYEDLNISSDPNSEFFVGDGENAFVEVLGLFPDTEYYIWIKAKQKEGDLESAWSSPVFAKTLEIQPPDIPVSVGPASELALVELGLDYLPITEDSIIVTWEKDENDKGESIEGSIATTYSYTVAFADNVEFISPTIVEITEENKNEGAAEDSPVEILEKNMVKFNDLKPNRSYFVKVKTKIEIVDGESDRTLSKESEYSDWVRIITKASKSEYTGEPDNEESFEQDYEQNLDLENGVWDYKIVNPEGIITTILNKDLSTFKVDMDLYEGFDNAKVRRLTIPVTLLNAMDSRNMDLEVETNDAIYTIKPRSVDLGPLKSKEEVVFSFTKKTNYSLEDAKFRFPDIFELAEETNIYMIKETGVPETISGLNDNMDIKIKLHPDSPNVKMKVYDIVNEDWLVMPSQRIVNNEGTYLEYQTNVLGINALYSTAKAAMARDLTHSMQEIGDKYSIKELGINYFGNTPVYAEQFTNLLLGMAYNKAEINLNNILTQDEITQINNSGLYDEEILEERKLHLQEDKELGKVTNEEAVSGLVSLYERKNGYIGPEVIPEKTIEDATEKYERSLNKAINMQLINPEDFNPNEPVNYDTICDIMIMLGL
ncbi:MAG: hypothetical protein ATN31_06775 [Candidatus Epulonipiscioides saccharophilum]|nr:MAG: hypothetical protein ATN31_06775 [Epulopiscium sp. AS2M-Bin001]